jgi:hypothetical protein
VAVEVEEPEEAYKDYTDCSLGSDLEVEEPEEAYKDYTDCSLGSDLEVAGWVYTARN